MTLEETKECVTKIENGTIVKKCGEETFFHQKRSMIVPVGYSYNSRKRIFYIFPVAEFFCKIHISCQCIIQTISHIFQKMFMEVCRGFECLKTEPLL